MFQLSDHDRKLLVSLNADYSLRVLNETKDDGKGGLIRTSVCVCDITDRATGKVYASGKGESDPAAVSDALKKAAESPKPLTPAQEADAAAGRLSADAAKLKADLDAARNETANKDAALSAKDIVINEKDAEIAKLKADLEAATQLLNKPNA